MNKIVIENEKIIEASDVAYKFEQKKDLFDVSRLILEIKENMNLCLNIKMLKESKFIIIFNINENVRLNLSIITSGHIGKIQYKYNLGENSSCRVEKFNDIKTIREMVIANLESKSNLEYYFKSIVTEKENYDYMIYHNGANSNCNVFNGAVNESGTIYFQISNFIPKDINGCVANQFNRIINLTNNKCEIKPNLYIDCDDVEANHSALIDKFADQELFYIKSRGINEQEAMRLLTRGFLLNNIENQEIIYLINKKYGGD